MRQVGLAIATLLFFATVAKADADYERALRRSQYLLNATVPTDSDYASYASSDDAYKARVRAFLDDQNFYDAAMRYHERLFGTGLDETYLDELNQDDLDGKVNKTASITCDTSTADQRYECYFANEDQMDPQSSCPSSWQQPVSAFWYAGVVAWVCPAVVTTCGSDLSLCFIEYADQAAAQNAELGTTEIFDTRYAVIKSLSKQSAGIAAAVAVSNYPYTKVLEPGLTAIDGAMAHFLKQGFHFDLSKLSLPPNLVELASSISLSDPHYNLVNTGPDQNLGGAISTYSWLRRYEKNRTRANQLYQRLLCHEFTSMLPRVFPADPGNLRTTPGCMGCHATLDPLADFYTGWGEGGNLYAGESPLVQTQFNSQSGEGVSDLANIIRNDNAFATCTVQNVWQWLMGRGFYRDEANLRAALTSYFVTVNYSFKELVYAVATHPGFIEGTRADATVGDPLDAPPLGQPPGVSDAPAVCAKTISYTADIAPSISQCTSCHVAGGSANNAQDLTTEAQWKSLASQAVTMMASGNMPPGQAGPPLSGPVWTLKEAVRCWLEQNP